MNKNDLQEIEEIIDSSLEIHLASVHEEIRHLRTELKADIRKT